MYDDDFSTNGIAARVLRELILPASRDVVFSRLQLAGIFIRTLPEFESNRLV